LQKLFYNRFLDTHYEGRSNIPAHTNFIVAANHTSHLDMGLTKMALGEAGKDIVVLAAADYFFDTRYKRAVMENFTNLVPMERSGSLRQSLRHARSFLDRGYNALIFPEGTRSLTGEMAEFKPVVGYLALHAGVGILPIYLEGTHEAMPKARFSIKPALVKVIFHPPIEPKDFGGRDCLMEKVRVAIDSGLPEECRQPSLTTAGSR